MNILITGGAGFIGSHTADRLISMGHQVRILDCLKKPVHLKGFPAYIDKSTIDFVFGDVSDKTVLAYSLNDIDVVYHLAAYQDYMLDYSTFSYVNTYSTSLLFELIESLGIPVKKVIVASSQAVMGEGKYLRNNGIPVFPDLRKDDQLRKGIWNHLDPETGEPMILSESDEKVINPQNPYAMSKYQQEMLTINLGKRTGIPSVALRYSIVQGPRQSFYNAYSGACRIFSLHYYLEKPPVIYEDGLSIRDFVNIHDVVDANVLVMEKEESNFQVYNVGGGKPYSVLDFAYEVAYAYGSDLKPSIPKEYRFGDTRHIISSIKKIKTLGWEPKRTIFDSIKEYKEFLEEQTDIEDILDYAKKNMAKLGVIRRADL